MEESIKNNFQDAEIISDSKFDNLVEKEVKEKPLMSLTEFEKFLKNNKKLLTFEGVQKYKSVNRAIKRGHVTSYGMIMPDRPYNNRGNTSKRKGIHSRENNELKRRIYALYKQYNLAKAN